MSRHSILLICLSVLLCSCSKTSITDLKVQQRVAPIDVEDQYPLFSWRMESTQTAQCQTAYRVVVTDVSNQHNVWDSGIVDDSRSVNITYAGEPLKAEHNYRWTTTVWDAQGHSYHKSSTFATGLMDSSIKAWEGAQWIGSTKNHLDATSLNYFIIRTTFRSVKGDKISFILGANDFRHLDAFQNSLNIEGENFVRVEVDLSGVGQPQGAAIRLYRKNYAPSDDPLIPVYTIDKKTYPETNLNTLFTPLNKMEAHTMDIQVENSNISFVIDGTDLITAPPLFGHFRNLLADMHVGNSSGPQSRASKFAMGAYGNTHDYNTMPHLSQIGFGAHPHSEAVITEYCVLTTGQSVNNVLFDASTTKNIDIFNTFDFATVADGTITLSNSSESLLTSWADPSHGALTMLRHTFEVPKDMIQAKLYISSMGAHQTYINGENICQDWFLPGDTQFRETIGYHAFDITSLLQIGTNCIGSLLSPGWYTGPMTFTTSNYNFFGDNEALLVKLVITSKDGSRQIITTDPQTWKVFKNGPVRYGSFFQGERYDANYEELIAVDGNTAGWTTVEYDDETWDKPQVIEPRPWIHFDITARYDEPVRVRETLQAKEVMPTHSDDEHTYTYNMGVNLTGVPSITIPKGWLHKGDTLIIRYGEQCYPGFEGDDEYYITTYGKEGRNIAGRILHETYRTALATDFYIAKNSDNVVITPSTTFRGYQYIQITTPSHQGPLPVENVSALVLSSDNLPTGRYTATTSDTLTGTLVNQLFKNIQRSQLGNFFTIPTDCPQRNERMGWTGDAQAYALTGTYNSDALNFFRQWMVALRDDQGVGDDVNAPGGIGSTVPTYNMADDTQFADGTTWAAAVCMVPWQLFRQYGNTQVVEENMDAMLQWLNGMAFYPFSDEYPHLSAKTSGLADWLAVDNHTPSQLVNNAIYIYMMEATAVMADAIGRTEDAQMLRERHSLAKAEWNACYVDPITGKTRNSDGSPVHTQSSYATPLNFNVFSDANKANAAQLLAILVENPSESHMGQNSYPAYTITTGFSGTPNILPALTLNGYNDQAFRMFICQDFTSWLYPVKSGATSVWERWNGYEVAFGPDNQNNMNSFNHFALGAVGQWMYAHQLGIVPGPDSGYHDFVLQPTTGYPYTALEGSYFSNYGTIHSQWTADGYGTMTSYSAVIPANTTATLYLPVAEGVTPQCLQKEGWTYVGRKMHNNVPVACFKLEGGKV